MKTLQIYYDMDYLVHNELYITLKLTNITFM